MVKLNETLNNSLQAFTDTLHIRIQNLSNTTFTVHEKQILEKGLKYANRHTREIQVEQLTLGTETSIKYAQYNGQVYRRTNMMRNIKCKQEAIQKTKYHHICIQCNKAHWV